MHSQVGWRKIGGDNEGELDYEFNNIESLIRRAVSSTTKSKKSLEEHFAQTRRSVANEKVRARNSFAMQALSFESKDQAIRYVQYHQSCLTRLINDLYRVITNPVSKVNSRLASEIFLFADQIEEVLDFIQREFSALFNFNAKIPESKRAIFLKRFSRTTGQLIEFFSVKGVEPGLAKTINQAVEDTMKSSGTTYSQIFYVEELVTQILNLEGSLTSKETDAEVRSMLLTLNFNSPLYIKYYTTIIRADYSSLDSDSDKAEKLALHSKIVNQSQQKAGMAYDGSSPSIKEQVSNWLWEEIQFINRDDQGPVLGQSKESEPVRNDFKIEFDMSVSQFAFFTRAFVESGVIQNKNISELIRFLSKFVRTKRSGSISQESLRIKYYDVEDSTKDAVRNTLHNAIGYINSK